MIIKPFMKATKEEAEKTYLRLRKAHAKNLNVKIPVVIDGKRYIIHPNGKIYKDINLNDF